MKFTVWNQVSLVISSDTNVVETTFCALLFLTSFRGQPQISSCRLAGLRLLALCNRFAPSMRFALIRNLARSKSSTDTQRGAVRDAA